MTNPYPHRETAKDIAERLCRREPPPPHLIYAGEERVKLGKTITNIGRAA